MQLSKAASRKSITFISSFWGKFYIVHSFVLFQGNQVRLLSYRKPGVKVKPILKAVRCIREMLLKIKGGGGAEMQLTSY